MTMKLDLNWASRKGHGGGPKRTITEIADEFGVHKNRLCILLGTHGGPKPVLKHRSIATRSTWYDPTEMRKWWHALPEDVRNKAKL